MNTARAFGPAVVSGFPSDSHWIVSRVFSTLFFVYLFLVLPVGRNTDEHTTNSHTVLAGTISGRTPVRRVLYHFDTVRHGSRRAWEASYFYGFPGSGADAKETVFIIPFFGPHSYQYWTLNPGQEATEPKLSPPDPVGVIRAEDRGMNGSNAV